MNNTDILALSIVILLLVAFGLFLLFRQLRTAATPAPDLALLTTLQRVTRGLITGGQALLVLGLLLSVVGTLLQVQVLIIIGSTLFSPGVIAWVIGSQIK